MALSFSKTGRGRRQRALSETATRKHGGWVLFAFGVAFFGAGLLVCYLVVLAPLKDVLAARDWSAVPCTVGSSHVESHQGEDGTTYSVEITYRYEVDGRSYTSDRRSFAVQGSSSGRRGKQAYVDAHPPGTAMTCYVDPADPSRAVLDRSGRRLVWWSLLPLPFLAVGFFAMRGGVRAMRRGPGSSWQPPASVTATVAQMDGVMPDAESASSGPIVLRPGKQRLGGAFGLLLFAVFWNGIVGFFAVKVFGDFRAGDPDWCVTLFLVPFVLVGIFVVFGLLRQVMLVFAPVIELTLDRRAVPVGGAVTVKWRVVGRLWRLTSMTVVLVGEEKATYRQGTDTVTDTHTFFERVLAGAADSGQPFETIRAVPERGSVVVDIPADTMHTFAGDHNQVVWTLNTSGTVRHWPDPEDSYELPVLPMRLGGDD